MASRRMALADMLRNELEIETDNAIPLSHIFEEEPVSLTTFVTDKQFLNQGITQLSATQYDFVRHFEQVLNLETYILMVEEFGPSWVPVRFVNHLAVEWGKGSGKDHSCQIAFARLSNILLSLKSPQEYFGMPHQTIIHMLNVAASAPQAHGVFFKPLRTLITRSAWFKDKFDGDITPSPLAQEIRFKKQIELISGHSQAETLEGKNLIAAIADEISAFPTLEEVKINRSGRTPSKTADGIIEMLQSSATTRFPKNFKLAQISYPRFKGDAIEQALLRGKADNVEMGDKSRYYVSGPRATWDVNPRYDQFERIAVPGATEPVPDVPAIVEDYKKDPAYARAKYECLPELAENRFFANDAAIYAAFSEQRTVLPVEIEYYWGLDESGSTSDAFGYSTEFRQVPGWQVRYHYAPDFRPVAGALYCMHGDMAIIGDRAGVAMAHVRAWDRRDWEIPGSEMLEQRPVVKMDFCTAFEADATGEPAPREVQIRWYRKLIWELRSRGFQIMQVSFDGFQSTDSMQILESWGIPSVKASTDRNNELYDSLRDVMYDGRLEGYYNDLLVQELRRLSKLRNGKIDHPPGFSKDLADALAGAVGAAVVFGGDEGEEIAFSDDGADFDFGMSSRGAKGPDIGLAGEDYAASSGLYGGTGRW